MFRWRRKQNILVDKTVAAEPLDPHERTEPENYGNLPFIDNETLDQFLADPWSVELLPVDPYDYRREIQRMIVSAFLHEASQRAKQVEAV